jgi:tetratricopeptide (TPR) repeat protein
MTRKLIFIVLCLTASAALSREMLFARGFGGGGGFRGGGGFGGGGFRGGGGFGGGDFRGGGGFGGAGFGGAGYGAGARGGYGGMSSFGRTPSFSSPSVIQHPSGYGGGMSYGNRGVAEGMSGGRIDYGSRSGSYTTNRGTTINYGAAGIGGTGPGGTTAGRAVGGAQVTTPGGRSFTDLGRAGGAVGPGGNAVGGRSNLEVASGPRGTAVGGSRGIAATGPGGGAIAAGSRGGVAVGQGGGAIAGRSYGAAGYRPYGYNAYGAYHQGWVHGYWNGHNDAAWGWRNPYWAAWGLGAAGLGWGLASWGFGSSLYGMGYMPYANPYYAVVPDQAVASAPYDYSQPINTVSAPESESVANPAMELFDAGRASFEQGNYADALQKTNDALAKLPNDTTLHEFRALCLFALERYDEAAATLYAVLSVGPGWDWTTLISLYPNVDVYTKQQRALEEYCNRHRESATARFVLAYHYLTQGHNEAAVNILKQVVALNPNDTLSAKLLRQLDPPKEETPTASAPAPAPADTTTPQGASITGTWHAQPVAGTSVDLTLEPSGTFTWQVTQKGQQQQFAGTYTYADGLLTLAQEKGPTLVGRVSWKDPKHVTFRIVGDGPDDPGLNFSK